MSSDSSQVTDLELQFKKRARRRLVGAVALVLVMLVVLPMVLEDHEHSTPQQAVTISIPSQSAEFTAQAPIQTPTPAPIQNPTPAVPSHVLESPVIETQTEDLSEKPEVKSINHHTTNAVAKDESEKKVIETKKTTEAKRSEEVKKDDDKKNKSYTSTLDKVVYAKQSMSEKPNTSDKSSAEVKMLDDSGKPYYLQIGVFSESVNVTHLQKKLSEVKLKSYTEKIATDKGEKTRLRVGPFENKEQADRAFDKLRIIGLSGFVSNK